MHHSTNRIEAAALTACSFDRLPSLPAERTWIGAAGVRKFVCRETRFRDYAAQPAVGPPVWCLSSWP